MMLRTDVCALLVCCSALWVVSFPARVKAPPPSGCTAMLAFSSDVSFLSEGHGNIHRRSVSPWSWRSSTVKNRIPSTLWEAECSSSFCSGPGPGSAEDQNLNSVPIHQSILVLTRLNRTHCYSASFQTVAVGCTCIRVKTTHR